MLSKFKLILSGGGKNVKCCIALFSVIFYLIISLPLCLQISGHELDCFLVNENRALASKPNLKKLKLNEITSQWELYFKDHLPLRNIFIGSYIYLSEVLLKSYVSENITGKYDELFNASPVVYSALGVNHFDSIFQECLRLSAAGKFAFFYSKNIPFYLFIAPDKTTLYPEFLPFYSKIIKHQGAYVSQIDSLKHSNIPFYDLKVFLDQFRLKMKLYDKKFDNVHWNGNAMMLAYPYMASVLAKNNNMFNPVETPKYYEIFDKDVMAGVYGIDRSKFIKINKFDNIKCGLAIDHFDQYHNLCINNNVSKGTLWFFSDSYFGATHGANKVTPFVHNVHTYLHSHYDLTKPYTDVANYRLKKIRPDAVIEEFVERMWWGGRVQVHNDPLLRTLGDVWLKTGGYILDSNFDINSNVVYLLNCNVLKDNFQKNSVYTLHAKNADPIVKFSEPVKADYLGRVVVIAKYSTPQNSFAQIFYRTESDKTLRYVVQNITRGKNLVHMTVHVKPFEKVYLRFDPGAVPGNYVFEDIPEVNDLRNRMKEDGI